MALGDVIARLSVSLGLETAAFEKGSRKAQQEVRGLQSTMTKAAGAIGGALAGMVAWETVQQIREMTRAAVDSVGALGEQAQQLGVTTDALQEYRFAATQVGVETSEMDQGLAQLTRRLGDAAQGAKAPAEAFERLGLSLSDIRGKSAGDVIPLIAEGMAKLPNDAERAAVAVDLFGKAGQKLLPLLSEGAEGVNKLTEAAREFGLVLTPEEIANADKYADAMAALDAKVNAQLAAKLAKNAEALYEFELAMADAKVALAEFIPKLWTKKDTEQLQGMIDFFRSADDSVRKFGISFNTWAVEFQKDVSDVVLFIPRKIGEMVTGVSRWIDGELGKVWANAELKIRAVAATFNWLYDVVIGHSYVPDMVDGIAREMARLDAVMVKPAQSATGKTAKEFEALRDTLDRLFPEIERAASFRGDLARIQGSGLEAGAKTEAAERLWREFTSGSPFGSGGGLGTPDFGDAGPIADTTEGIRDLGQMMDAMADKAKITTVRVADSFKDMADKTLGALSRLSSAIKGGDFLSILEGVIGLGLQLGSIGVFGKGVAGRINKVPSYASGTNFHPGGMALVGERGPELVSMPRGSKVYNNDNTRGMMGGVMEIRPSPLFEVYVDGKLVQAAPALVDAGGTNGVSKMRHSASRRWR